MLELVENDFAQSEELETLARYCLTETIKNHIRIYFEEGFEEVPEDQLYHKVNVQKVKYILSIPFYEEICEIQHNPDRFLKKKVAQLWQLLANEETQTPDLFLKYLLYRMVIFSRFHKKVKHQTPTEEDKKRLKKLLKSFVKNELDFDEGDEAAMKKLEKEYFHILTDMRYLLGYPEASDNSLTFDDWDFTFFDDVGIKNTLHAYCIGPFAHEGYDIEGIFASVGEPMPLIAPIIASEKQH